MNVGEFIGCIMLMILAVLILIGSIVVIISIIVDSKKQKEKVDPDGVAAVSVISLAGIAGLVVTSCWMTNIVKCMKQGTTKTFLYEIMSVDVDKDMQGTFFLGCGRVKNEDYYCYYYNTERGITQGKVKTSETYLIETNETNPGLYKVREKGMSTHEFYYQIHIPVGTVKVSYHIN